MPKKTIHYAAGSWLACGMNEGKRSSSTTTATEVTCKACRKSTTFKQQFPELAISHPGGRKKMEGVVLRTFNLRLPFDLNEWLEGQKNMAGTIVKALEMMRKRN